VAFVDVKLYIGPDVLDCSNTPWPLSTSAFATCGEAETTNVNGDREDPTKVVRVPAKTLDPFAGVSDASRS
jgi:hypothetical protein